MAGAFRLNEENPNMSYMDIMRKTTVKGLFIPYMTLNDRLAGCRGHGTGYCTSGKRTPCVLSEGKS